MRCVRPCEDAALPLIPYISMTMMKYASLACALVLGLTLAGAQTSAQLLDVNGSAGVDVNVYDTPGVDGEASTEATVEIDSAETNATSSSEVGVVTDFSFSKNDMIEGMDFAVTDSGSVRSSAGLESYAASSVRDDERLEEVAITDGRMDVEYRQDARFLWVIPASMRVKVAIAGDGDVSVRYPWYAFLMATRESRAELETRLEAEVTSIDASIAAAEQAELSGTVSGGIQTGSPDVRRWARILDRVHTSLSTSASAEG